MTGDDTTISVVTSGRYEPPGLLVTTANGARHVATFHDETALALFLKAVGGEGARLVRRDTEGNR